MVLAVVIPHPVTPQLAKHTYLCAGCNQTKTYILPVDPPADDHVATPVNRIPAAAARIRGKTHSPHPPPSTARTELSVALHGRDISRSGARLELFKEAALPQYFLLSLLPDGSGRRLCSKVWQLALIVGVRFAEKPRGRFFLLSPRGGVASGRGVSEGLARGVDG